MPRVAVATGPISHSSHTATIHSTDYTPAGCRREKSGGVLGRARGLAACRPEGYGRGGDTSPVRVSMRASEFGIEADSCIGPTKLGGLDGDRRRPRRSRLRKLRWQAEMPQDPLNHTRLLNQRDEVVLIVDTLSDASRRSRCSCG